VSDDRERADDRDREAQRPASGLRNPAAAVRGLGAAAYAIEGLVLLLAIQPMRVLGANLSGVAIGVIIALALVCFTLAGMLRRRWAWYAALLLQAVLLVCGVTFHGSLAAVAVLFGLVWAYVLHVRRIVIGRF
jgi:hypothetical protein